MLDEVSPDNPVFLHDWTNHLAWVNSAALKAAKISKDTPDPQGGVIDRDSSGNPDRHAPRQGARPDHRRHAAALA